MACRLFHKRTTAFISSIIFSVHPIFSEAANAVRYREDLSSATFLLAAFILFLKSTRSAGRSGFITCYTFSLIAYLLALLSKEMAITLPFLILAYGLIFRNDISSNIHNAIDRRCLNKKTHLSPPSTKKRGSVIDYPPLIPIFVKRHTEECKKPSRKIIIPLVTQYAGYLIISAFYLYLRFSLLHNPGESSQFPGNSIFANGIIMTKLLWALCKTVVHPRPAHCLNRAFRYQLTVLDDADNAGFVQAKVAKKIGGNSFTIRSSAPWTEVSWQVTGIRKDGFAEKHRIPVEQDKPERERGLYLHPDVFGQPEQKGVDYKDRTSHARPGLEPPTEPEPAGTGKPGAPR